jgi:hypothetical protein
MLGKLFKHEMKATSRLLLPVFLILAVFTILDRIVLSLDIFHGVFQLIPGLITIGFVLCIIAVVIVSSVIVIIRFYKNLVKDEGYLMFTLPVKPSQLINSKLIAAVIWTIASVLAAAFAIFIVATTKTNMHDVMNGFHDFTREFNKAFGSTGVLFIIEFIALALISIISSILMIYVSIALGQLFNGHKLLGSIISYVCIYTVLQIVSGIFMAATGILFADYIKTTESITHLIFPIMIVATLVLSGVYYFVTDFIFRKKLNLD